VTGRRAPWRVMYVTDQEVWRDGTASWALPDKAYSLDFLVTQSASLLFGSAGGVIVLDRAALPRFGLPLDLGAVPAEELGTHAHSRRGATALRRLHVSGWSSGPLAPWIGLHGAVDRSTGRPFPRVAVAVHPWLDPSSVGAILSDDAKQTAWLMARYHELTGGPFLMTPGVSGVNLLREAYAPPRTAVRWRPDWSTVEPVAAGMVGEAHLVWETPHPQLLGHEHTYDGVRAYLAAAQSTPVAASSLRRHLRPAYDPRAAGYWQISCEPWNEPRLPDPYGPTRAAAEDGRTWVTTPTLALLMELAGRDHAPHLAEPQIYQAWTAPGSRVLRKWAEKLNGNDDPDKGPVCGYRQARAHPFGGPVSKAIKQTYQQTIGQLTAGGRIHRPDWSHAVIAAARANVWRRMLTVAVSEHRWPLRVRVDAVTYGSDLADPVAARPATFSIGDELGQFTIQD
jgi:hypothetical protein